MEAELAESLGHDVKHFKSVATLYDWLRSPDLIVDFTIFNPTFES